LDSVAGLAWLGLTTGHLRTNRTKNRTVVLPPLADSDLVGVADLLSRVFPRNYAVALRLNACVALTNLRFFLSGDWAAALANLFDDA
jgi:hypothetical protein